MLYAMLYQTCKEMKIKTLFMIADGLYKALSRFGIVFHFITKIGGASVYCRCFDELIADLHDLNPELLNFFKKHTVERR
jgi:hypothetical protein